jgi:hypothetical protein
MNAQFIFKDIFKVTYTSKGYEVRKDHFENPSIN